jgi:uncharacterized OB-fold protein
MPTLEKVSNAGDAKAWQGDIPISSRYTVGIAGEAFLREIKDQGRFLGTRCSGCSMTYVPPVMFCERCFAQLDDWVEVASTGVVFTYTVLYQDLDEKLLEQPDILAYVKLDRSDGGLIHRLGGVGPDEVEIGMEVEAVWKPPAERAGSILDIEHFRPLQR